LKCRADKQKQDFLDWLKEHDLFECTEKYFGKCLEKGETRVLLIKRFGKVKKPLIKFIRDTRYNRDKASKQSSTYIDRANQRLIVSKKAIIFLG